VVGGSGDAEAWWGLHHERECCCCQRARAAAAVDHRLPTTTPAAGMSCTHFPPYRWLAGCLVTRWIDAQRQRRRDSFLRQQPGSSADHTPPPPLAAAELRQRATMNHPHPAPHGDAYACSPHLPADAGAPRSETPRCALSCHSPCAFGGTHQRGSCRGGPGQPPPRRPGGHAAAIEAAAISVGVFCGAGAARGPIAAAAGPPELLVVARTTMRGRWTPGAPAIAPTPIPQSRLTRM
jgi:hypothetical protein